MKQTQNACHGTPSPTTNENKHKKNHEHRHIALVGNPNVGKSLIFNNLTGAYVTVSNYPGTTVDVSEGYFDEDGVKALVSDTPGMYSMKPISEEEKVARDLLLKRSTDLVIHVIDAKNIHRMLPLTLQLIEAGFRTLLILNIMDEAEDLGIEIDTVLLEKRLGINVIKASAANGKGIKEIRKMVVKELSTTKNLKDHMMGDRYAAI